MYLPACRTARLFSRARVTAPTCSHDVRCDPGDHCYLSTTKATLELVAVGFPDSRSLSSLGSVTGTAAPVHRCTCLRS